MQVTKLCLQLPPNSQISGELPDPDLVDLPADDDAEEELVFSLGLRDGNQPEEQDNVQDAQVEELPEPERQEDAAEGQDDGEPPGSPVFVSNTIPDMNVGPPPVVEEPEADDPEDPEDPEDDPADDV